MHNRTMRSLFQQYQHGESLHARSFQELSRHKLDIRQPSELIANSPVLQRIIRKHWHSLVEPWLRR
ncbi:hypothetical protein [Paenibacillus xylaniclasticus]|uniref:hypothetical protein n=1 Tax=Paenibacillus xylaniclasticus TaxID=588083 RepID=UPI000FD960CF|nr:MULTISPECIES: hypothetical protein [Paenibacillus]GFN30039.1 hypothetical protein PCURB6_02990 [Paenibacillus curdlanolyticus]